MLFLVPLDWNNDQSISFVTPKSNPASSSNPNMPEVSCKHVDPGQPTKSGRRTCLLVNIVNGKVFLILYVFFQGTQTFDLGLCSGE